jgi:alpha-tubulin suppressor-like RCC1 family protein
MTRKTLRRLVVVFGMAAVFSMAPAPRASAQIVAYPYPVYFQLNLGTYVSGITAGFAHTCVRRGNGSVYCWGLNSNGEIGVTSTANCILGSNYNSPYPCVDKPQSVIGTGVSQVAAGDNHTCALLSGVVSCWGAGGSGQVGNDYSDHPAPQVVATNGVFTSIAAGGNTTCGVSSSEALCWGEAPAGTFLGAQKTPNVVNTVYPIVQSVAVGKQFLCVLMGSSLVDFCIGNNASGQLGVDPTVNGTSVNHIVPSSMNSQSVANVRMTGGRSTSCVEHSDGTAQCVGANQAAQLGVGFSSSREWSTLPVGGTLPAQLHGVTAGWAHTCALDANNHAFCWGSGEYGQLGNGGGSGGSGSYYSTTPQMVVDTTGAAPTFRALAAGAQHTCGIGTDNYVYCWGDNTFGQIGAGLNNVGPAGSFGGYATFTAKAVRTAAF